MTDHTWVTGEPEDCAQVGFHAFTTCSVCGVYRVDPDRRGDHDTFLRFETEAVVPQDTIINVDHRAIRTRKTDHWVHFSLDCAVAQEQVLFYVLGRLHALMAVDSQRYGGGSVITKAIQDQPRTTAYSAILNAYRVLESQAVGSEAIWETLEGRMPIPFTGVPFEVEL